MQKVVPKNKLGIIQIRKQNSSSILHYPEIQQYRFSVLLQHLDSSHCPDRAHSPLLTMVLRRHCSWMAQLSSCLTSKFHLLYSCLSCMVLCHVLSHIRLLPEHTPFHVIWHVCHRTREPSLLAKFVLSKPPAELNQEVHNHENDDYSCQYAQDISSNYGFAVRCFVQEVVNVESGIVEGEVGDA